MQPIEVDIWSDIACPWCYIGKRKFESALSEFSADPQNPPVEVVFHSYELSPDTPVDFEGGEIAFLVRHKGIPAAEVRMMLERVTEVAAEVGLRYDFAVLKHTNTVLAHQLLHFAKSRNLQREAYERLLKAYFEQGRHVGRIEDLADLAAEIGLDRAAALESLRTGEFLPAVRDDQRQATDYRVRGVPCFIFDGEYEITGAQDSAVFLQALTAVATERVSTGR
jgi:predicted DsbA family dithiol-disulfide isomerase